MIIPYKTTSFSEAMKIGAETYQHLKSILKQKYRQIAVNVGDEGGFAPDIQTIEECFEVVMEAVKKAGYDGKVGIGIDAAASEFYVEGQGYDLDKKGTSRKIVSGIQLVDIYLDLIKKYPSIFSYLKLVISIEDPFDQEDWDSWISLTSKTSIQIVGDDLLVTNPNRIKTAIEKKACNALLLKVNQIGTLSESFAA